MPGPTQFYEKVKNSFYVYITVNTVVNTVEMFSQLNKKPYLGLNLKFSKKYEYLVKMIFVLYRKL